MADLFPIFLKLQGRKVLLVGGGRIAEQKIAGLLTSGAQITVVAPSISEAIAQHATTASVRLVQREFTPSDLDGVTLVVAATGEPDVNERIFREAELRNILCNAVDEPERCHFYYPSVVRRGDLQIAISTNGKSPALAQRIRIELEEYFDGAYAEWLQWLGRVRDQYFRSRNVQPQQRVSALHRIASREVYERFRTSRNSTEVRRG